jgi:putative salt-induced outer membrane protein YdiY
MLGLGAGLLFSGAAAWGQVTVKNDGEFRSVLGMGASFSSGNSDARNFSLTADGVRATDEDKWTLGAKAQYASSEGVKTAEQLRGSGRYDRNLSAITFWFAGLDLERNTFANLSLRSQVSGGGGWHVFKSAEHSLDLFAGVSYTTERYQQSALIAGEVREAYQYPGLLLGEESTHQITSTTHFKQKLSYVPNLKRSGDYRLTWDAGLSVAMSQRTSLTVGLSAVHNSDPALGRKRTDTLLTTGVSMRFD